MIKEIAQARRITEQFTKQLSKMDKIIRSCEDSVKKTTRELEWRIQGKVQETVEDINKFYTYFDVVRGFVEGAEMKDRKVAYKQMLFIRERYPTNPVLANKLDEARTYL